MTRQFSALKTYILCSCFIIVLECAGQPAHLLRDFNRNGTTSSSLPWMNAPGFYSWSNFAVAKGKGYFFAFDELHGSELWLTDGTTEGTRIVRELRPGGEVDRLPDLAPDYELIAVGDTVYFAGQDPQFGTELFMSDGTAAGTIPVMDFKLGFADLFTPAGSFPTIMAAIGGTLFFSTVATTNDFSPNGPRPLGRELWKTDGTAAGTIRLRESHLDQRDGVLIGGMIPAGVLNGVLYYNGYTEEEGAELWRSDGTPSGTYMLKDLEPRMQDPSRGRDSNPDGFISTGKLLYFTAYDENGSELWRTDGTRTGTFLVRDFRAGIVNANPLTPASSFPDGRLYAAALNDILLINPLRRDGIDESSPEVSAIYITDGTQTGTTLLAEDVTIDDRPVVAGGKAWFLGSGIVSRDPDVTATGLWVADTNSVRFVRETAGPLAVVGDLLYHAVGHDDGSTTLEAIAVRTETTLPPVLAWPGGFGPVAAFSAFGDLLFFSFSDGVHGQEPWISDGTAAGTHMLKDINTANDDSLNRSSNPDTLLIDTGNGFYFRTFEYAANTTTPTLWLSDGADAGTKRVDAGVYPDTFFGSSWGDYFMGALFYADAELDVNERIANAEVYRAVGAQGSIFKDVFPIVFPDQVENPSSAPDSFFHAGPYLYFKVRDPYIDAATVTTEEWVQLWRTDGTEAGTIPLQSFAPGPWFGGGPVRFFDLNGTLLFLSTVLQNDQFQLWRSDGDSAGTTKIFESTTPISHLKQVGTKIFFFYNSGLWVTDGSAAGTSQVAPLDLASGGGGYEESDSMAAYQGSLYFSGLDMASNEGIYRSDGTAAGTSLAIPGIQRARYLTVAGDSLYFTTTQNGSEPWNPNRDVTAAIFSLDEIWQSDGTLAGTRLVYNEVFDRSEANGISQMVSIQEVLFLLKTDRVHGTELWRCDGTREGTTLVQDIFPGPDSAFEAPLLSAKSISGNNFIFAALTELGTEPWVMSLDRRNIPAPVLSVAETNIAAATGQPLSMPITVVSGGPVQFTAHNLPPGVRIDPVTGLISGAPSFKGLYKATVDAMNGAATRSVRLEITVNDILPVRVNASYEAANGLRLSFEGSLETLYVLESSPDLNDWDPKADVSAGSEVLVPLSELRQGKQFFRLRSK